MDCSIGPAFSWQLESAPDDGCRGRAFHKLDGGIAVRLVEVAFATIREDAIVTGEESPAPLARLVLVFDVAHGFVGVFLFPWVDHRSAVCDKSASAKT